MAVTENSYTGNGSTTNYSFTFPYLKSTDIEVQVDATVQATSTWSLANATTVQFNSAPANGAKIKILRQTNVDNLTATFYAGSAIKSEDLNDNYTQNLYKTQEVGNRFFQTTGGTMTGDLTMGEDVNIIFEGATANAHETTLTVTDPTADRTITLPNVTGTVVTTGDTGTVATAMIAADAINGTKLADNAVDSEHYTDGSIDRVHLAADIVDGTKIADDSINSEHYVDGSIDTAHIADAQVTTAKIADDAVTSAKLATNITIAGTLDVTGDTNLAANSIGAPAIAANAVTTAKIANEAVTGDKLANNIDIAGTLDVTGNAVFDSNVNIKADNKVFTVENASGTDKFTIDTDNGNTVIKGTLDVEGDTNLADNSIGTAALASNAVTTAKITNDAVTTAKINADAIDSTKIADNAVTTDHIADAELTTLAGMQSGTASVLASSTALAATTAEINTICDGKGVHTTISDSDDYYPTSGAVVDYVAAQISPIGGFEVIATEVAFPATASQPASGVAISIADAQGVVFNGSGVSTTGRTTDGTPATVTINGAPSSLYGETLAAGVGLMVTSTGSSNTYNYHKLLAAESDVKQLSDDINDFNARYRVNAGEPGSNNDEGDLVYDTNANKMKVYDGSSWGEVTSTGDFKFLVPVDAGTTTAATWDGNDTSFDLKEGTNSGSAASITSVYQIMVSVNGVIQKPNTGSWSGSGEGFYLTDSDTIRFATAPPSGSSVFIIQFGSALNATTPADNTVATAKIQNLAVTGGKIADDTITEGKLDVSNAPTNGQFLQAQSGEGGGLTWAAVPAGVGGATGVDFNDDVKARWGTGNDLEVFHDASDSRINNATGRLKLKSNGYTLYDSAGNDILAIFNNDAACEFYYDNVKKLETVSGGATITGTCTATAFAGDGSALTGVSSSSADGCIWKNTLTISNNHTIAATEGAHSVGPITNNATVTVNGRWVIS